MSNSVPPRSDKKLEHRTVHYFCGMNAGTDEGATEAGDRSMKNSTSTKREPISVQELLTQNSASDDMVSKLDTPDEVSDFEQYRAEHMPEIKPGTAAYALAARFFNQPSSVFNAGELQKKVEEGKASPGWASPDEFHESNLPSNCMWRSDTAQVHLTRNPGRKFQSSIRVATLNLQIRQTVISLEPFIYASLTALDDDSDSEMTNYRLFQLTLAEAVEAAHLLLLMVDAATETVEDEYREARQ